MHIVYDPADKSRWKDVTSSTLKYEKSSKQNMQKEKKHNLYSKEYVVAVNPN